MVSVMDNHDKEQDMTERGGWRVEQSIAMELDMAITTVYGYFGIYGLTEDVAAMLQDCSKDWIAEGYQYIESGNRMISIMEIIARLCGVLLESDYRTATLAMRALRLEDAVAELRRLSEPCGLRFEGDTLREQFVNGITNLNAEKYQTLGFDLTPESPQMRVVRAEAERIAVLLQGEERHDAFWLWMDRFYYEQYRNWREKKIPDLEALRSQTIAMLGARSSRKDPPALDWLPPQNPLRSYPELKNAVAAGTLEAVFWVEPFGLSDTWTLYPDQVVVSFSEPGILYENFKGFVEEVSVRAKALADPTRLMILRMIRQFDLMNTEMADLLGLSRPTVSVHARILREAGLIRSYEDGRAVRHQIVPEAVRKLFDDLERLLDLPELDDR